MSEGTKPEERYCAPVIGAENLLSAIDETRFGMVGGVEDFARVLIGRGHDDEAGLSRSVPITYTVLSASVHVEDANGTESTRVPLFLVVFEGGVQRICELANDGDSPGSTGEMTLLVAIDSLLEGEEGEDDGGGGVEPCGGAFAGEVEEGGAGDAEEGRAGGGGEGGRRRPVQRAEDHGCVGRETRRTSLNMAR